MKILFVINAVAAGGAEYHLLRLAKALLKSPDDEIKVAVLKDEATVTGGAAGLKEKFEAAGISIMHLRSYGLSDLGRLASLVFLVRKNKPQILHSHLPRSDLLCSLIKFIFPSMNWVCTIHDSYNSDKYRGFFICYIFSFLLSHANRFIAVSDQVATWIRSRYGESAFSRTTIIYHGIDVKNWQSKKKLSRDTKRPVIGCLARYEPRKGQDVLIKAMKYVINHVPDAHLWLCGSDPSGYATKLVELSDSLGLSEYVTVDHYQNDPREFYNSIDLFALASRSEGFGIVLIEAMASQRPVVASNIFPMNFIVVNEVTGSLAESNNVIDFADKIVRLLANPDESIKMGEAGFRRCVSEFSLTTQIEATISLYRRLVRET